MFQPPSPSGQAKPAKDPRLWQLLIERAEYATATTKAGLLVHRKPRSSQTMVATSSEG